MDSRIELQPDKTIIVLGAGVIASLTTKISDVPTTFKTLKKTLLQTTSDNDQLQSSQLQKIFSASDMRKPVNYMDCSSLDRLLEVQRNGALLAYMYPDVLIDQAMGQEPLSAVDVDRWESQHCKGIMHLYGVCSDVESMQCLKEDQPSLPSAIVEVFKNKLCVCVGFESDQDSQSDVQSFISQLPAEEIDCILFPSETVFNASNGLSVPVSNSHEALCSIGDTSKAIGNMIEHGDSSDLGRPLSLLMASKTDYVKAAKLLSTLPGNGFTILNSMEYSYLPFHVMTMHVSREKFQEFWFNLVQPCIMESLMKYAVLAIIVNSSTFIWLGGGKSTKTISTPQTLGELMCRDTNVLPVTGTTLLSQTSQVNPTSKHHHRTHPRYTVKKQKIESKLLNTDLAQSSCVLKRRMSLSHHPMIPNNSINTPNSSSIISNNQQKQHKLKNYSNIQASSRQQFLLNRYLLNRKNEESTAAPMKPKLNILRQLLQEERKEFGKPNTKSTKHLSEWVTERRRNLFVGDSQEWSSHVSNNVEKKISKWRKIKEIRLKKEEAKRQERVRRTSLDSNASSTSSDIKPHFSAAGIVNGPLQSPLLTTVNPYILPHATNLAALQASMMYQPSYLSSYPLVTTLPVPYLLQNSSNLVLLSSGSLGSSTATVTATSAIKNPTTVSLMSPYSTVSVMKENHVSSDTRLKRKHSKREKSYSEISSLLMKKNTDHIQPPPVKQSRMVSSPSSLDYKSDEDESNSELMSCDSSESEENQLPLWQFLLELLLSNSYSHLIDWSRIHSLEFEIKQSKEIAKLWSAYKADGSFDYNRYKKVLEYYCTKDQPILNCVAGKNDLYQFSSSMVYYINNRYSQLQRSDLSVLNSSNLERSRELCGSQEVLVVD